MHITDEKISELIVGKLSGKDLDSVISHAADCSECSNLIAASVSTYENINNLKVPELKKDVLKRAESLVVTLPEERSKKSFFNSFKLLPAVSVLIFIILLGTGTWYYFNISEDNTPHFRTEKTVNELQVFQPTDEGKINKDNLVFQWQKIKNVAEYNFVLFDEFGNVMFENRTTKNSFDLSNKIELLPGKKYAWQVDAELLNASKVSSKLNVFTFIKK